MTNIWDRRAEQLKHQFGGKRILRRLIFFPVGLISLFILAPASVVLGKDVDYIDHILNKFLSHIPVLGDYLADAAGQTVSIKSTSTGETFVVKYLGNGLIEQQNNLDRDLSGEYRVLGGPKMTIFGEVRENVYQIHQGDQLEDHLTPSGGGLGSTGGSSISLPGLPNMTGGLVKLVIGFGIFAGILYAATTFFAGPEWASYLFGQTMDAIIIPADIDPELGFISQASAVISCVGEGPDCIREHQAEMTREPTAEAVGETFQVEIEDFQVGQGGELPVGYRDPEDEVSLTFNLINTRSGVDGIEAYDVQYRVRIIDRERGHDNPYCDSGWQDIEGTQLRGDKANDLQPGVPAGTGFQRLEEVTIGNCEMQQPGLGDYRTVALQVRYNYSSLGEVDFEVMGEDVYRDDPSISQNPAYSEALDTPVQAGIRVMNDPVLFTPQRDESNPISFNAQVEADNQNVEFRVNDLAVEKPELAQIAEEDTCDFELVGDNELRLRDEEKERIIPTEEGLEEFGEDHYWFEDQTGMFGCNLEITDTDVISETGETFSMMTRTNYTVTITEEREGFEVYNEACERAGMTCPMLVTQSFDEGSPFDWRTSCTGRDSGTGCSIIDGDTYGQTPVEIHEEELRQGEYAIDPASFDFQSGVIENDEYTSRDPNSYAVGLTAEELDTVRFDHSWALTTFGSGNVQSLSSDQCEPEDVDAEGLIAMHPHPDC